MKRQIFVVCLFYCFLDCQSTNLLRLFSGKLPAMFYCILRLQIYEAISAIFWQSASYAFYGREPIVAFIRDIVFF